MFAPSEGVAPAPGRMEAMDDLVVPPGPGNASGLVIPAHELTERFTHSGGPGGQGVNTSDSRVQLSWDIAASEALSPAQRERALRMLSPRLNGSVLSIEASERRSQRQNRAIARERLTQILRTALIPPVPRRPSKPTKGSQRRRLEAKRQRGETKRQRRRPDAD